MWSQRSVNAKTVILVTHSNVCFNDLASSVENATVTYHLQFGVPAEDDGFMEFMMSEELVLGIVRQNFHDKNLSSCESLGLDPESLLLYGK